MAKVTHEPDDNAPTALRRYTFKLYPSATQEAELLQLAGMLAQLWNALLEMRETHYRRALQSAAKRTLTAFDQGKEITKLRAECPEWRAIPAGHAERVAGDLDKAFKAFYSRAKSGAGAQSGYPRYKSSRHADAIALREPSKSSWRLTRRESGKSWTFTLRGIGAIRARGKFPVDPESLRTADVKFYAGAWWLSVCCKIDARRSCGAEKLEIGINLIDEFAVVKTADGRCAPALSDPFFNGSNKGNPQQIIGWSESPGGAPESAGVVQVPPAPLTWREAGGTPESAGVVQGFKVAGADPESENARGDKLLGDERRSDFAAIMRFEQRVIEIQSQGDRHKRGSYRWRKSKQRIARIKARIARIRKEALHRWSTEIVSNASDITISAPPLKENIRSGRGNVDKPGAQVETIAELNKRILGQAAGAAIAMLEYKAAAAGIRCDVVRLENHEISVGKDLKAAAVAQRKTKRIIKRKERAYA
jgi:transposase